MNKIKAVLGKELDSILDLNRDINEQDLISCVDKVINFFKGDLVKARKWFFTENLNFGGTMPRGLIMRGRANKVITYINSVIPKENKNEK